MNKLWKCLYTKQQYIIDKLYSIWLIRWLILQVKFVSDRHVSFQTVLHHVRSPKGHPWALHYPTLSHSSHRDLGPISLTVFHHNSNWMENSVCSHLYLNTVIATKFYTWHNSCAVIACAKICCNLMASNWSTVRQIVSNLNCEQNSLV